MAKRKRHIVEPMKITVLKAIIKEELLFLLGMPALIWQVLFLYVPLFWILGTSMISSDHTSWWKLTFSHYATFFDLMYVRIIMRSLVLAGGAACSCLLLGYPVAYFLALHVTRAKNVLLFFITLPFWTNFLIQIYAWFFLLNKNGFINALLLKMGVITEPLLLAHNQGAIFVVMTYCYMPFMIMPLYTVLQKVDKRLLEASLDLGASAWQTFWYVTVPLSWSGIRTGLLLVFVPAFGEFAIPTLVGGSKYMMVGSLISYYFLIMRDTALGSAFTCMSSIVLIVSCLVLYSISRMLIRKERNI
ncbi:MAG TPA: ABC transporter permease [Candidatus Bathyarchaeia archaeon]|nr:ABC transporter permease [Candidatus Bathyarchaeia archaeon]